MLLLEGVVSDRSDEEEELGLGSEGRGPLRMQQRSTQLPGLYGIYPCSSEFGLHVERRGFTARTRGCFARLGSGICAVEHS